MYMYNEIFVFGNYEILLFIEFCKIYFFNNKNYFVMYSIGRE